MDAFEKLEKQLDKLKISKTERQILLEDFDWSFESFEEDFIKENHKAPSEKDINKFIKEFIEDNAKVEKGPMRQVEKEEGQWKRIVSALKYEKKHLSIKEMSDLLLRSGFPKGSSEKTLYRRIRPQLEECYNIKKDSDGKYYYEASEEEEQSAKERAKEACIHQYIESINILSNFLETIKDSPVYEKARDFIESQKQGLSKSLYGNIKNQKSSSRIVFLGAPEMNLDTAVWNTIYQAMDTNSVISITYQAEGKKQKKMYTVKPFQMIFDNGLWELWGECIDPLDKGRKLFNVSRISHAAISVMKGTFVLPKDYDFLKTVSGNFGCYTDEKQQLYKIKFQKDSYAWLYSKNRIWGDNQSVKEIPDGFILSFKAKQFKPILRWVLGWGEEVEPMAPAELVGEWKERIGKMGKLVGNLVT